MAKSVVAIKADNLRHASGAYTELYNDNGLQVWACKSGKFEIKCGTTHKYAKSLQDIEAAVDGLALHQFPSSGAEVRAAIVEKLSNHFRLEIRANKNDKDTIVHTIEGSREVLADSLMAVAATDVSKMAAGVRYAMPQNMYGGEYMVLVPMSSNVCELSPSFAEPQLYEKQEYARGQVLHGICPLTNEVISIVVSEAYPNGTLKDQDGRVYTADEVERLQFAIDRQSTEAESDFHQPDDLLYQPTDIPSYNPIGVVKDQAPILGNLKNYDSILSASAGVLSDFMKTCKGACYLDRSSLNKVTVSGINAEGQATDGQVEWNCRVASPSYRRTSNITIPLELVNGSIDIGREFIISTGQRFPMSAEGLSAHLGAMAEDDQYREPAPKHRQASVLHANRDVDNLLSGVTAAKDEKQVAQEMKDRGYTTAILFEGGKYDNLYTKTQAQAIALVRDDFKEERNYKIVPIDEVINSGQVGASKKTAGGEYYSDVLMQQEAIESSETQEEAVQKLKDAGYESTFTPDMNSDVVETIEECVDRVWDLYKDPAWKEGSKKTAGVDKESIHKILVDLAINNQLPSDMSELDYTVFYPALISLSKDQQQQIAKNIKDRLIDLAINDDIPSDLNELDVSELVAGVALASKKQAGFNAEEIAETFINGNISDASRAIGGSARRFRAVQQLLEEWGQDTESFNRLMSQGAKKQATGLRQKQVQMMGNSFANNILMYKDEIDKGGMTVEEHAEDILDEHTFEGFPQFSDLNRQQIADIVRKKLIAGGISEADVEKALAALATGFEGLNTKKGIKNTVSSSTSKTATDDQVTYYWQLFVDFDADGAEEANLDIEAVGDGLTDAAMKIESNVLAWMNKQVGRASDEGHSINDELLGSVVVDRDNKQAREIVLSALEDEGKEPLRTSSGTLPFDPFTGVEDKLARVFTVDLSFSRVGNQPEDNTPDYSDEAKFSTKSEVPLSQTPDIMADADQQNNVSASSVPDQHQLRILKDTVKNPAKGFLGGPSAAEAEKTLREKFNYTDSQINQLKNGSIKTADESDNILGAKTLDELKKAVQDMGYEVDDADVITSPGRFEREHIATVFYNEGYMAGDQGEDFLDYGEGDTLIIYKVTPEEATMFEETEPYFALTSSTQGFIGGAFMSQAERDAAVEEYANFEEDGEGVEASKKVKDVKKLTPEMRAFLESHDASEDMFEDFRNKFKLSEDNSLDLIEDWTYEEDDEVPNKQEVKRPVAGKIKGSGIPAGTGSFSGLPECTYKEEFVNKQATKRPAKENPMAKYQEAYEDFKNDWDLNAGQVPSFEEWKDQLDPNVFASKNQAAKGRALIYKVDKMVSKDTVDQGVVGNPSDLGIIDQGVAWSADELFDRLKNLTSIERSNWLVFENGRLTGNINEDANGNPVDGSALNEEAQKLSAAGELYLADYTVYIELGDGSDATEDQLTKLLGLEKYGSKKTSDLGGLVKKVKDVVSPKTDSDDHKPRIHRWSPEGVSPKAMENVGSKKMAAAPENILNHYLVTALWSSSGTTPEGKELEGLDSEYGVEDFTPEARAMAEADVEAFLAKAEPVVKALNPNFDLTDEVIGHDFWLTRNGHGAGFWDGDYPKEIGDALTKISKEFGDVTAYVTDDNYIDLA